ncbi:hypothetical protein [Desulfovibrio inopinatus]|uniref:hypothetical protein n=1 Tax=Desulfovibrio inopinatus TaxID=102109 RepID=UPI0003F50824|nr:hypothetical protein [Desulfovibrio inopinatus]
MFESVSDMVYSFISKELEPAFLNPTTGNVATIAMMNQGWGVLCTLGIGITATTLNSRPDWEDS